jgi:hypothetical protein
VKLSISSKSLFQTLCACLLLPGDVALGVASPPSARGFSKPQLQTLTFLTIVTSLPCCHCTVATHDRPTILPWPPWPPSRHLQLPSLQTATHLALRRAGHRRLKRTNGDLHHRSDVQSATDRVIATGPAAATTKPNVQSVANDCKRRLCRRIRPRRNACGRRSGSQRPLSRPLYGPFCVKKTACLGRRAVPHTSSQLRIHAPTWFTAVRRSRSMYTDSHNSSDHGRTSRS